MIPLAGMVPWLIESTIKMSALLLIALAAIALLRRRSAALRHWLLAMAIACAAVTPLLGTIVPTWNLRDLSPVIAWAGAWVGAVPDGEHLMSHRAGDAAGADADADGAMAADAAGTQLQLAWLAPWGPRAGTWDRARPLALAPRRAVEVMAAIAMIWIAGVAITGAPLLIGFARLAWIAKDARPIARGRWHDAAVDLARELGMRRPIRLLRGRHPSLLVTWGLACPRVLLPAPAMAWSDERVRVVLLHELAHVRRGDWAIQIATELLRCLCWFNPIVWLACTRLRRESELACDDVVLRHGVERTDYAAHVVELARSLGRSSRTSAAAAAATMASPSGLERRIRVMLNGQLDRRPLSRVARVLVPVALIVIALPLAGLGVPRQSASIGAIIVDQAGAAVPGAEVTLATTGGADDRTATTDATGHVAYRDLPAGDYQIVVTATGFAPLREQVTLSPDQRIEHRLVLSLGSVQETIVVSGANQIPHEINATSDARLQELHAAAAHMPLVPPIKVRSLQPGYPPQAYAAGIEGTVNLDGRIAADGTMADIIVLPPANPALAAAAREAVEQWRFEPTLLHGKPVDTHIRIAIQFVR